jgi:hypothetical protein
VAAIHRLIRYTYPLAASVVARTLLAVRRCRAAGPSQQLQQWFNTQAFAQNALGTFGTSSRDLLHGPRFADIDFALVRAFSLGKGKQAESRALQFRGEFFNFFNRANFNNPTSSVTSSSFGRILGAGDPRIVQLGLKFVF